MFKSVRRVLAAGVSALLLVAASTMPANAASVTPNGCEFAPALATADQISSQKISAAIDLKSYVFSPGVANGSFFFSKVVVAHTNLSKANLLVTHSPIGKAASQLDIAAQVNSQAYINSDYFNEGNGLPYSAIIKNGTPVLAPPGLSKVVGTIPLKYSLATGFPASAQFTIGGSKFILNGVNLGLMPTDATVAYTAAYSGSQLPTNTAAALVKMENRCHLQDWIENKPRSGALLIANGSAAKRLAKFKVGVPTTMRVPAVAADSTQVKAALVRTSGSVTSGGVSLPIVSVNYDYTQGGTGIRLYDSNFTNTRFTARGTYTVSVNSGGLVQARYKPGRDVPVPTNGYVLQLNNDGLGFYNASPAGTKVAISNTFVASHNFKFINASGAGAQVLVSGDNQQDCLAAHEQIRPRTAIGWNNATGDVWLMTTSSGQDLNDFGFRMGGSTIHQVFDWLKMLGATDAVTLDGGGSTTLLTQDGTGLKRQDIPDSAWMRDVVVGLALVAKD